MVAQGRPHHELPRRRDQRRHPRARPQKLVFSGAKSQLSKLKPGAYTLVVEAAREVGGHEAVRVPFTWGKPGKPAAAKGASELGAVTVSVK